MNKPKPFIHQETRDEVYCLIIGRAALPLGFVVIIGAILVAFAIFSLVFGLALQIAALLLPAGMIAVLLLTWLVIYTVGLIRRVNRKDLY